MNNTEIEHVAAARQLHQRAIVIDTHCDTTMHLMDDHWDISAKHDTGHVDISKMRDGGVDAMFFAVWAPGPIEPGTGIEAARAQIKRIGETVQRHSDLLVAARTAEDIRNAHTSGRIALVIAIEGGYLIEDSLDILREYAAAGAAYLTLTHAFHTTWADSSGVHERLEPLHGGLTDFGREVVRELNRLGVMVDVSHVSDNTFRDVVETTAAPIIASHSSCRAVHDHCRNLSDDMMRTVAASGGVVQINFAAMFLDPDHPPIDRTQMRRWWDRGGGDPGVLTDYVTPLTVLVDHFDHALQVIGPEHVGIGSDFDGVPLVPGQMEDCSKLPNLTAALLARGYSEQDLELVLGANVLRVMEACRDAATVLS